MGYFILVEKDSNKMQKFWKWIIISFLIVIAATCIATSYVFQSLQANFNSNCVSSASIVFKPLTNSGDLSGHQNYNKTISNDKHAEKVNKLIKEFKSYYRTETINATDGTSSKELYEYLNDGPTLFRTTTEPTNVSEETKHLMNLKDEDLFRNSKIDEINSLWGDQGSCGYFFYIPIAELICAIVWIVFIVISGHRGDQVAKSFIHKAWRLVVPAIVCFTILTIFSAVYAGILNSRLNDFCDEFKSKFKNKNVPCELLITRFSLNDDTAWSPAMNFILCKFFSWLTVLLWLLAALIMLMRCILGADFNIEEEENYIEAYGTELEPDAETLDTKLQFKDAVRRYSHERIYKPTTKEPERVAGEK